MTALSLMTPMDAIPTPDFAVPYAAPKFAKTNAAVTPVHTQHTNMSTCVWVWRWHSTTATNHTDEKKLTHEAEETGRFRTGSCSTALRDTQTQWQKNADSQETAKLSRKQRYCKFNTKIWKDTHQIQR